VYGCQAGHVHFICLFWVLVFFCDWSSVPTSFAIPYPATAGFNHPEYHKKHATRISNIPLRRIFDTHSMLLQPEIPASYL